MNSGDITLLRWLSCNEDDGEGPIDTEAANRLIEAGLAEGPLQPTPDDPWCVSDDFGAPVTITEAGRRALAEIDGQRGFEWAQREG